MQSTEDPFDFLVDYKEFSNTPENVENADTPEAHDPEDEDSYEEIIQGSKKTFRCNHAGCGKIFKFKSEIVRHTIIHQKDRPYPCTYAGCKKSFKRADALENHKRIHAGVLPFECNLPGCDRKFATKAALRYHQIRHRNNRVFKCNFEGCNKTFLTASQLKQHHKAYKTHCNCPEPIPEEKPTKMAKLDENNEQKEKKVEEDFSEELPDQTSKLNESIQWEMMSQENEEDEAAANKQADFKKIIKHILKENKILKMKLEDCEKRNGCRLEKDENRILRQKLEECERRNGPCSVDRNSFFNNQADTFGSIFDNEDWKLLEFLKGHEDDF